MFRHLLMALFNFLAKLLGIYINFSNKVQPNKKSVSFKVQHEQEHFVNWDGIGYRDIYYTKDQNKSLQKTIMNEDW